MRTTFLAASSRLFDDAARQGIVGHKRCLTTTADPLHCLRDGDYDGKLARQKHRAPNNGGGSPWYSCLPRSAWMRRKWLNYSRHTAENSGKGAGIQGEMRMWRFLSFHGRRQCCGDVVKGTSDSPPPTFDDFYSEIWNFKMHPVDLNFSLFKYPRGRR